MNIAEQLEAKLTSEEFNMVAYFIYKASENYNLANYATAREALEDAVAILMSKQEYNAAEKVKYYLRFC